MTAELGTMKVTEQIDALRTLAAHPVDTLVMPRFLALLASAPLLTAESVVVSSPRGDESFDAVVMACHAPTTLSLLDSTPNEQRVLSGFAYQTNEAILHTDVALLPRRQKVWSAWNYMAAGGQGAERPVAVSYLINQLQPLPFKTPMIVTLNPHRPPDPAKVIARFSYEHPVLDQAASLAQSELPALQGQQRTWFCGAWTGFGFHEDGLKSALRVARAFGVEPPWKATYD